MGVLNLGWLIDPPDYDLGLPLLREWTIAADGILDLDRIELAAVGPRGERRLASLPVEAGAVFAQVATEADEILRVRSGISLLSAPPQVLHRWIVPWSVMPVAPGTIPLAVSDGALWVVDRGEVARVDLPGNLRMSNMRETRPEIRHVDPADVPSRLAARFRHGREGRAASPRTVGRGQVAVVLHRGGIVFGMTGPLVRATEAAGCEQRANESLPRQVTPAASSGA